MPPAASQTPRIFICYRRDDSAGHAGRLYDGLAARFGREQIFMDIDLIEPGEDFVQAIEEAVGACEALLALIGRGWLSSSDRNSRRLDNPNDFVRLEIATALGRDIRVIPVLVHGATMPKSQDLPDDLAKLARRHAHELSDLRWNHDVEQLIGALEKIFARKHEEATRPRTHVTPEESHKLVPATLQIPSYNSQSAEGYKPDATAIRILTQLEDGPAYEGELGNVLKIESVELGRALKLLEQHDYIRYLRSQDRPSYIELNQKGRDYLNKPDYNGIPFQTREAPRVLRYVNAYHPDDVDTAILLYMYEEDTPRLLRQIVEKFGLNSHEARYRMNRLREGGYVSEVFDPRRRWEQYRLTVEGVEYILWLKP
jgi:hypothetical protein